MSNQKRPPSGTIDEYNHSIPLLSSLFTIRSPNVDFSSGSPSVKIDKSASTSPETVVSSINSDGSPSYRPKPKGMGHFMLII